MPRPAVKQGRGCPMENERTPSIKRRGRRLVVGGALLIFVMLGLLALLLAKKETYLHSETKIHEAALKTGQMFHSAVASRAQATREVVFLGEARPYATVTLYSKVSGYIKEFKVDKGDHVATGQILAVIESPEIDRQLDAAVADAKSKTLDARRALRLFPEKGISEQDLERAVAADEIAQATVASAQALREYELIKAPFASTVTARYADPGALVQAAINSQTTALPVVTLSQIDRLRVYVYVDQKNAGLVRVGDRAEITDPGRPEIKLTAAVTRISGELDPRTRTGLVEVDVANRGGRIVAGSFVQVTLWVRTGAHVEVPAQALTMRGEKPFVAIIDRENKARIRPVVIAETDGKTLEISEGIQPGEKVLLSPGISLQDGAPIQPIMSPR
jgi:membrane fusion protein, multidrug efflux system